jgi:L-ectoine synthase
MEKICDYDSKERSHMQVHGAGPNKDSSASSTKDHGEIQNTMKVVSLEDIAFTSRQVECPNGGFVSLRYLLASDGMGFSMTNTFIPKGRPQRWHYSNHLEACLCVSGKGLLVEEESGERFPVEPGTLYALNNHDAHTFQALEDTTLICVFNPPLFGREVHNEDGAYELGGRLDNDR